MTRSTCALFVGAMVLWLTEAGSAAPPWTKDGNCLACHSVAVAGALTVANQDGTANPNNHGNYKVFQVNPGQSKPLFATVSGLADGDRYMVMLKGLTGTGVNSGQAFQYGADCNWSGWWNTFFTDPPRSNDPSYYYEAPNGPAQFQYNLSVNAACPNDYYDLTFAVVGTPKEGTGFFYGEEHFYVQVGTGTPTGPAIGLNKTALIASAATGANPPNDSFTVSNTGTGTLTYTITDSASWLTVSPTNGSAVAGAANTMTVQYNTTSLAAGTYSGTITVAATGATNTPQTIDVSLTIGGSGGDAAAGQTLYNQRCVSCHSSPAALAPVASRITTNMSSLTSSHNGITLTTQQVADLKAYLATFTSGTSPSITLNKTSLAPTAAQGANAPNDTFTVTRGGSGTLSYTITDSASWMSVSPTSGSSTGEADTITVQYSTASLAAGTYSGTITVAATGATNSPQTIDVNLTIGGSSGGGDAANGQTLFNQMCSRCHSASSVRDAADEITTNMSSITSSHNGITLTTQQVADLKAYLTGGSGSSPSITLNKTSLAPTAAQGANPPNDTFTVARGGSGTLSYTITDSASWMSLSRTSGSSTGEADTITVQYNTASLAAGTYSGTITVAATGATNSPQTIDVNLTIGGSSGGGDAANGQTLFNQMCSRCHSASSVRDAADEITTNMSSITSSHNGITLTTQQVADLKAYLMGSSGGGSPSITLNKTSLAPTAAQGANPPNDTFTVARGGSGTLSYTITDSASWMSLSRTSGSSTGEADTITVQYNTASLSAGTYSGTITVSAGGATNSPQTISVSLTIGSGGGGGGNAGNGQTLFNQMCSRCHSASSVRDDADEITTNMSSITSSHNGITLTTQQVADLKAYLAGGSGSSPSITLNKTSLSPTATRGSNAPSNTFTVANGGGGTLNYTIADNASWMSLSRTSGSSTGEADTITLQYNTASLSAGTYSGTITVSAGGATNSPQTIRVTLTVTSGTSRPTISLSRTTLSASATRGSSPRDATFTVRNSGGGTLNYTVADNARWLSVTPTSGSSTGESDTITVHYSTRDLSTGTYSATITVSGTNATNSPRTIRVTLTISRSGDGDHEEDD